MISAAVMARVACSVCVAIVVAGLLQLGDNGVHAEADDNTGLMEHLVAVLERLTVVDRRFENVDRRLKSLERRLNRRMSDLTGKVEHLMARYTATPHTVLQDLRAVCAELPGVTDNVTSSDVGVTPPSTRTTERPDVLTEKVTFEESTQSAPDTTTPYYDDSHCRPPPAQMPLCKDFLGDYDVHVPGILGFLNYDDAGLEMHQFFPLIKVQCSPHLTRFLCRLYFPKCDPKVPGPIGPCSDLCEGARSGCEELMARFGFQWPEKMACSQFPAPESGQCFGISE